MLELGQMMRKSGRFAPIFHLAHTSTWVNLQESIDTLKSAQYRMTAISHHAASGPGAINPSDIHIPAWHALYNRIAVKFLPGKVEQVLRSWLSALRSVAINNVLTNYWILRKHYAVISKLIRFEKPSIVILSIDIPDYETGVYIKAAHKYNIPVLVYISLNGLGEEWVKVYSDYTHLSTKRPMNSLIGKLFPKWVHSYNEKEFIMMPSGQILARELLGVAPPSPWIDGSTNADAVIAESNVLYQRGISSGLSPDKLHLTGSTVHDDMQRVVLSASALREQLYQTLGLPPGKPMILTSILPPYYGRKCPNEYFPTHKELVEFWFKSLAALTQYNVVVCLHPSMKYDDLSYIEQWGPKISGQATQLLIPLCHLFVTSQSSTITYAVAAGKPVINFDVCQYRHKVYTGAPGTFTMEDRDEYLRTLHRLTSDNSFYREISARQQESAPHWGILDGQAGKRILDLCDMLVAKRQA